MASARIRSRRKKGERPPGRQKGHTLDRVETLDQIRDHAVSVCEGYETLLEQVTSSRMERRQVHDIPQLKILVTEHLAGVEKKTQTLLKGIRGETIHPICHSQNRLNNYNNSSSPSILG